MMEASACMFSSALRLWLHRARIMLIIIILYGDVDHKFRVAVQAAEAEAPTNKAIEGVMSDVPSTIFFNQTKSLRCDSKEKSPGYITTVFLFNSRYAFGCLSNDTSSYYYSVALSGINFPNTPVWLANRHHPVKEKASLFLTPQGSLLLQDSDGTHVWSSGRHNSSNPAGLRLTAEGNLIFFDDKNFSLWESFMEPVDLLVPGQFLKPGGMLVAGFSSHATPTGSFIAVMNPGGLIFYENSTSQPLPYYALRYPLVPATIDAVLTSPCNHTELQLTNVNLTQIQLSYTPSCKADELAISFGSPVVFIRLEANGVLRGYYPDHKPSYDVFQNSSKGLCGFPNACGPYGICEDSRCVCPGNQSMGQYFTQSSVQQFLLTATSCIPRVQALGCQEGGTRDHHFLDVEEVDYFANDYMNATLVTETFEQCKAACAHNCLCQAAFYRIESMECYLHESVMSMIRVENDDFIGAIKLQKQISSSKKSEVELIIGISVVSLISVFLFGVWYYYHKKKRGMHRPLTKDEDDLLSSLPGQPKRFSFKELRAATREFSQKLGVGGFGSVYRGVFPDGSNVAVKQLENNTGRFTQGMKEFRNEVTALSNINHQNLVHLRGFCADGGHRLLVYEYVPNGSLDTWLFRKGAERPGPVLDWKTRLAIAVHTARGLVFLHEQCRNRIVHLDIKPQNILLDERFVPKLSDFGLSRLINEDKDSAVSRMRGTPGYMAPECLILSDASEKSDVYSFGMVLLEIVSGRKNVDVSRLVVQGDCEGWYFPILAARKFKEGNVHDIIDKSLGQLGSDDMVEVTRVIKIAFWCIQDDPSLRPTMGNALLMLEGYSKVIEPPLSYHFGMRFHLSSSLSTNSCTPHDGTPQRNICSPKKFLENGDHHHHQDESKAKTKEQNQGVKGDSTGLTSPCKSPLSSHQTSPRTSPVPQLSSFPSSAFHQASPRHSSCSNMLSPHISPTHRTSPHYFSPISSPHRASPLPSSPLSRYSQSPFHDTRSRHPSPLSSSCHSPISSPQHV